MKDIISITLRVIISFPQLFPQLSRATEMSRAMEFSFIPAEIIQFL